MDTELTPEQTEKLVQFQELSGIDEVSTCIAILERHLWNVEAAIHDHLGLDSREHFSDTPAPSISERHSEISHQYIRDLRRSQPVADSVAQRLLGLFFNPSGNGGSWLSNRRQEGFTGWVLFLTTLPLRIAITTFYQISSYVFKLILPTQRSAIMDPTENVASFIRDYDQTYGSQHPTFYVGTYSQALNEAKKELKFVIVYLHGSEHQDTERFCRETLSDPEVIQFINDNCLFWACSVNSAEGYRVSQSLRENTYPFFAVVVQREYRMTVVGRIEGLVSSQVLLERLQAIMSDNEAYLVVARAERQERNLTQALRQEQDEAYLESLRADQQKEENKRRQRLLEEERLRELQQQEEDQQNKQQELIQRKLDAVNFVPDEPSAETSGCCRILVRLPNGLKFERRFQRTVHTLKDLYYFILALPESPYQFEMATSFPKRTLPWQPDLDTYPTLAEVGLGASETLLVLDLDA